MPHVLSVFAVLCALLALAGSGYFAMSLWAALRFVTERSHEKSSNFTPPVSILRSVKGLDPQMELAFRSHCLLDYGEYEVLFGVSDLNDPALQLLEKIREEFPRCQMRVVHCPQVLGLNGKVSNLAQMLPQARFEHILINDSDIVVPRDYLRQVMAPFADPGVGMVTTLYRGMAGKTLPSRLEGLGLSTDFAGGVLVARALEGGIRFALGATMATTKTVLRKIGGLEPITDCLADDYELGARIAAAGYKVELADTVVGTALHNYGFRDFWAHQLRWARNVKDRRSAQYFGLIASFALIWPCSRSWPLLTPGGAGWCWRSRHWYGWARRWWWARLCSTIRRCCATCGWSRFATWWRWRSGSSATPAIRWNGVASASGYTKASWNASERGGPFVVCARTVPSLKGLCSISHAYPGLAPGANTNAAPLPPQRAQRLRSPGAPDAGLVLQKVLVSFSHRKLVHCVSHTLFMCWDVRPLPSLLRNRQSARSWQQN